MAPDLAAPPAPPRYMTPGTTVATIVVFKTPLTLSEGDITDLIAFLKSLRGQPVTGIAPPATFP
jgi:hypothetical protein